MTAQPSSQAEREDVAREVDRLSYLLFETWKRVDPHSGVAKHPVSYIANFADMARAVIADREHATPRSMPEEVVEALQAIVQRADAYPSDIFGEPDLDAVNVVLAAAGLSNQMDRMHASWARKCLTDVGNEARAAIALMPGASA